MEAMTFRDASSREGFWREHVARWASSSLSIVAYCRAQGLSKSCFHYWKSALKRRDARIAVSAEPPAFAEVRIAARREASIEIAVSGARWVRVRPGFDEETLVRVLLALERSGC